MQKLDSLALVVQRISNLDRNRLGGRVSIDHHSGTVSLNDCTFWGDYHCERVRLHFPDVHISIVSSRASLSGFTVFFKLNSSPTREILMMCLMGVMLAGIAWALLHISKYFTPVIGLAQDFEI